MIPINRNVDIYRETDADSSCKGRRVELACVKLDQERSLTDAAVTDENRLLTRTNANRNAKWYGTKKRTLLVQLNPCLCRK